MNFTHSPRLISMSICALLSGLALIIFYAWNLGVYNNQEGYYYNYCYSYGYYDDSLCKCTRLLSMLVIRARIQ
jgi:hypothetical protein